MSPLRLSLVLVLLALLGVSGVYWLRLPAPVDDAASPPAPAADAGDASNAASAPEGGVLPVSGATQADTPPAVTPQDPAAAVNTASATGATQQTQAAGPDLFLGRYVALAAFSLGAESSVLLRDSESAASLRLKAGDSLADATGAAWLVESVEGGELVAVKGEERRVLTFTGNLSNR